MSLQHARGAYLHLRLPVDKLLLHLLLGVCQIVHFGSAQADVRTLTEREIGAMDTAVIVASWNLNKRMNVQEHMWLSGVKISLFVTKFTPV